MLMAACGAAQPQPATESEPAPATEEAAPAAPAEPAEESAETTETEAEPAEEAAESAETMRGSGDTLNILYWQAASTLNPYLSGGTKDIEAASVILEPLARYDENGNMVPWLVEEIPTVENGGVAEDLTSITWKIKEGILWSDGTPFTAEDVKFSAEYCLNEEMGCNAVSYLTDVESVEVIDDLTAK
ncbi:MAG: hypothetical protein KDD89_17160, partial [Anaerolineales bacterium]|nr:hypothetical protein [Anaerolineales bacterium]